MQMLGEGQELLSSDLLSKCLKWTVLAQDQSQVFHVSGKNATT